MTVHARTRYFALLLQSEMIIGAFLVNEELYRRGQIPIVPPSL